MNSGNYQQNRGQQIRKLFDECLELDEAQQIEHIALSNAPSGVKQHVTKLLKISGSEIELTQRVIDSVQTSLDVKPITPNMKIGAYELKKPIGEGGQAEVWLAERSDGEFSHQVAIKFLKPLHDQKDIIRFHSERELLATLKHPNIAQLLDGGELGENRPYMVLEYVEGLPLLEYGLLKNFTLNQYLDCFRQICDAVSYAHSRSIIHRDIKPTNIYVTLDGVVKLLDFGIAKFLNQENIGILTMPVMTLAYSSPEQVTGKTISTATDIYGLGLLLYEMLTGVRAQAVNNSVPAEVIKEITDNSPLQPSEVIRRINFDRNYVARDIQGDMDNLVMMAIRKEPERRYTNVDAMANDIKNFQEGKSLIAAGDSWTYHAKKFIYRNPVVTLTSIALLVFMLVLPVIQYQYQQEIELERDKALTARKEAEEQKIATQKTNEFLINIMESASPLANSGEGIYLKDILKSAERQLTYGLDQQPKIKGNLLMQIAKIQKHLGNYDKASEYYAKALAVFESIDDVVGKIASLGELASVSFWGKDPDKAEGYVEQAEKLSHQLTDPVDIAWHQIRMVDVIGLMGKSDESIEKLSQTIELLRHHKIEDHKLWGVLYNDLSVVSKSNTLALAYIEKSLFHAEMEGGSKVTPSYFARLMNKAARLDRDNRKEEAEVVYLEAKTLADKLYSKDHPNYANLNAEMAALYHDFGRFEEAKRNYQESVRVFKLTKGVQSFHYVLGINNLAYLMEDMGDYESAEKLFRESLALREQYFSSDPMRVASNKGNLARLLSKIGRYDESQILLNSVLPVYQEKGRDDLGLEIVQLSNQLSGMQGHYSCNRAVEEITRLAAEVKKLSAKSWQRIYHELWLGQLSAQCGDAEKAKSLLLAAKTSADLNFKGNSLGQKLVHQKVDDFLSVLGSL